MFWLRSWSKTFQMVLHSSVDKLFCFTATFSLQTSSLASIITSSLISRNVVEILLIICWFKRTVSGVCIVLTVTTCSSYCWLEILVLESPVCCFDLQYVSVSVIGMMAVIGVKNWGNCAVYRSTLTHCSKDLFVETKTGFGFGSFMCMICDCESETR